MSNMGTTHICPHCIRLPLADYTVAGLRKLAKLIGLAGYSQKRKADLVDALTADLMKMNANITVEIEYNPDRKNE